LCGHTQVWTCATGVAHLFGHTQGWTWATGALTHLLGHTHGWTWATGFGAGAAVIAATVRIKVNIVFSPCASFLKSVFVTTMTV